MKIERMWGWVLAGAWLAGGVGAGLAQGAKTSSATMQRTVVAKGGPLAAAKTVSPASVGPRVFLLDGALLARMKSAAESDADRQELVKAATAAADKVMGDGPYAVTQKGITPPSGDKHDYMSQAPYWWADPSKPNGLPYIRHDGLRNPELKKIPDHDNMGKMGSDARELALAYYLTGDTKYSERAALLLKTWFLNADTKMNPNLQFGQGIPGINTGRGIGIIESRFLMDAVDAAGLLQGSDAWSAGDEAALRAWYVKFLAWLRTSKEGRDESAAKNNHGTWYDLQVTDFALFTGNRALAVQTLETAKTKRIALQVKPDGKEPLELVRTNAFSYSIGNLDGLMKLAWLGQRLHVDLWHYKSAGGGSIRKALDYLVPYAMGEKAWDSQEIGGFHGNALTGQLLRAAAAYHDASYFDDAQKLSGDRHDVDTVLLRLEWRP